MKQKAKLISVIIEKGDSDLLFATSPQMKSLFVIGRNEEDLRLSIASAVEDIYYANNEIVSAFEVDSEFVMKDWVIIPKII